MFLQNGCEIIEKLDTNTKNLLKIRIFNFILSKHIYYNYRNVW